VKPALRPRLPRPAAVQFADPRIVDDPPTLRGWSRSSAVHDSSRCRRSLVLQACRSRRARRSWYSLWSRPREGEFDATLAQSRRSRVNLWRRWRALLADPAVRKAGHDIKGGGGSRLRTPVFSSTASRTTRCRRASCSTRGIAA